MLYGAGAPGQPPAAVERHLRDLVQPDAAAVEHDRRVAAAAADEAAVEVAAGAVDRHAAERERALVLEEELALLRKEQTEPRQVDLLLVGFDLREVGVDGQVGGEALRDGVFHVEAGVGLRIVRYAAAWRRGRSSGSRSRTA